MRTDPVTPTAEPRKPSTFNLNVPTSADDGPSDYTDVELTVAKIFAVLVGTTSPSVTWTLRFAATRDATGTEVITLGTVTTSVSGVIITVFDVAVIPAGSVIWVETTAQSGTVDWLVVSVVYA